MQLIRWRAANNLSLRAAAKLLSVKDAHLSRLERGLVWVGPEIVNRILAATAEIGPSSVTVADHWATWSAAHPQESAVAWKAGLESAAAFRTEAKETSNGKTTGERRSQAVSQRQKESRRKEGKRDRR